MMATTQTAQFTADGTWTCPLGVSAVLLTMIGGGGAVPGVLCGGGGSGELVINRLIPVVPTTVYNITIGAKGLGSFGQTQPTAPTASEFNGYRALGAGIFNTSIPGSDIYNAGDSGVGAGAGGSPGGKAGDGFDPHGKQECGRYWGGNGGGFGDIYNDPSSTHGGIVGVKGQIVGGFTHPGGAGAGSIWGGTDGANGDVATAPASLATYGAGSGGCSAVTTTGGNGAPGYVLLMWTGP